MGSLILNNISKSFSGTKAVDDVSFSISKGKVFGLLGPNGAGKTTLIRIITNILAADKGTIEFDGKIVKGLQPMQFGYMPEERGMYKQMKVGEQLLYLSQLKGMRQTDAYASAKKWMEQFEIESWWNKKLIELSKGMQQKVQFISTLMHDPPLVILDEPFSGLDPINTELIKEEIFKLGTADRSIIFSTHRMEQLEAVCEDIALINKGKLMLSGPVADLKQSFKKNIFKIEFADTAPKFEDTAVYTVLEQGENSLKLQTEANVDTNAILKNVLERGTSIKSFNEELPSLNEIFIEQVNDSSDA